MLAATHRFSSRLIIWFILNSRRYLFFFLRTRDDDGCLTSAWEKAKIDEPRRRDVEMFEVEKKRRKKKKKFLMWTNDSFTLRLQAFSIHRDFGPFGNKEPCLSWWWTPPPKLIDTSLPTTSLFRSHALFVRQLMTFDIKATLLRHLKKSTSGAHLPTPNFPFCCPFKVRRKF